MISMKLGTQALENLLKDEDGTIKLELQQAVLEEFSKRHIKAIINDTFFNEKIKLLKKEAEEHTEKLFGDWIQNTSPKKFVLNQRIKDIIQLESKTAVTHELDKVEQYVSDIYKETAEKIKQQYDKKLNIIDSKLKKYTEHLEEETEKVRALLVTDKVDSILREHIRAILAETFSPKHEGKHNEND